MSSMRAYLRVQSVVNPAGITERPYFTLSFRGGEEGEDPGILSGGLSAEVWKKGKKIWEKETDLAALQRLPYTGPLESAARYTVRVLGKDVEKSCLLAEGFFVTGILDPSEWQAKWAKSTLPVFPAEKGLFTQPPATMFEKTFTLPEGVREAYLYLTCRGIYRTEINGARFERGEFAPGHSTYGKVLHYQTYDVTAFLKPGKNTLSVYVGDGWYCGVKTVPRIENFERRHAVFFQIEAVCGDGEKIRICSDGDVRCAYGPVIASDLYAGEKYDASVSFSDWRRAETEEGGTDILVASYDGNVEPSEEIPAADLFTTPAGETVLDFGKVLAGRLRISLPMRKGQTVRLWHTEVLDRDGNFFQSAEMPDGGIDQCDEYTAGEDGTALYEPLFTYHGFRYVRVEGAVDLRKEYFTAVAYSSQKKEEEGGVFSCSDERLNRLYANIMNSQRSNFFSIPTDCPQREKAGWTGDIGIYAKTSFYTADMTAFLGRWMRSVRADQGENGAVPIVVPYDGGYPSSDLLFGAMYNNPGVIGSSGWGDACLSVPYAVYRMTGNTAMIEENLGCMEKWCAYITDRCRLKASWTEFPDELEPYLWDAGYHQGDWLVPSVVREMTDPSDPIFGTLKQMDYTARYAAPIFGYYSFHLMTEMCRAVGREDLAEKYGETARQMRDAIALALFSEDGRMPTDKMGAYVLAIAFSLVPPRYEQAVRDRLVALLEENGGCLDTGFLSTPYLLDALTKIGRRDLAYAVLYSEKCPGWLYEVKRGATAIWESWENYEEDGQPKKISFNHYAFGCVYDWMVRNIIGLEAATPGYGKFRVVPKPDASLTHAQMRFGSVHGEISVSWEKMDGTMRLEVLVPPGTEAEIAVSADGAVMRAGPGRHVVSYGC